MRAFVMCFAIGLAAGTWIACAAGDEPTGERSTSSAGAAGRRSALIQPEKWWDALPRPIYASLKHVGTSQNWFEIYELPDGTHAICEPYQFEEAISYLVLGSERGVLIDTGNGIGNIRKAVEELTDLPVMVAQTHEHYDHVGGSHQFEEVALYHHPRAIEQVRAGRDNEEARNYVSGDYVWKPLPVGVSPETFVIEGFSPTHSLEDGEILDLGGRKLEVIYTPGHSPGSVCFLDRERRVLFTGDHFYPGPLYAHSKDADLDQYLASNQKLLERIHQYDHLLPGHNEPWVSAEVLPRVSEAFEAIFSGRGFFTEDQGLRRYAFDGFDILILSKQVRAHSSE